ncbi:MAG TPA: hypothetical protein VIU87_06070 [Mycobacterium sp.]
MWEQIHRIVTTVWGQQIGLPPAWTEQQAEAFLSAETSRICALIEQQMDGQGPLVRQWWADHGHAPDHPTTVTLINRARRSITEQVLAQELYEQIPTPAEPFPPKLSVEDWCDRTQFDQRARIDSASGDPNRWKDPLRRRDPSRGMTALSRKLWPDRSALFRVTGAFLLQARSEDDFPIPDGPTDPLAASFTSQVSRALTEAGKPVDGPGKLTDP